MENTFLLRGRMSTKLEQFFFLFEENIYEHTLRRVFERSKNLNYFGIFSTVCIWMPLGALPSWVVVRGRLGLSLFWVAAWLPRCEAPSGWLPLAALCMGSWCETSLFLGSVLGSDAWGKCFAEGFWPFPKKRRKYALFRNDESWAQLVKYCLSL